MHGEQGRCLREVLWFSAGILGGILIDLLPELLGLVYEIALESDKKIADITAGDADESACNNILWLMDAANDPDQTQSDADEAK